MFILKECPNLDNLATHKWMPRRLTFGGMENTRELLAANIRKPMESRGWKPADLKREARMPHTTLNNILHARSSASVDNVALISRAFRLPPHVLLSDDPLRYSPETERLVERYRLADDRGQYLIREIAEREADRAT